MNLLYLAGFLGDDAQERFTPNGKRVIELRLATKIRKSGGEDGTLWWQISLWDDRFDRMLPYLKKGTALIVTGEFLEPRPFTKKDGTPGIGLSLRAESIRFSPFGKPDKSKSQEGGASTFDVDQSIEGGQAKEMSVAGSEGFSSDDLPF